MHNKNFIILPSALGLLLILGSALWLATAQPVSAACGSQTSSCKNCHEIQGQDPVNNDGTAWHTQHAFGDFCYLCHAGNNQATDKDAAHTGMVAPLSDINANCLGCHPNDSMAKAQIYATTLGVEVGTGGGAATQPPSGQPTQTAAPAATESAPAGMVVASPDVVDYVQQYNETVLNQKLINWGNVIASVLIVLMLLGGSAFIFMNEKKRRAAARPAVLEAEEVTPAIHLEDYPQEVVALLPQIAALNPRGRRALQILLKDPDAASEILHGLSRLDPDLIKRVKTLDREAQALLLALAGD